jgi:hypothetical protein
MKEILEEFVEWLDEHSGEDAFYVFDETDEAITRFLDYKTDEERR